MEVHDRIKHHLHKIPDLARAAFVAPNAAVMGDVILEKDSSIWYGCVLRGDIQSIRIGRGTNVQDGSVVHLADDAGVSVGEYSTIGHMAMIHACTIGNECLIGMNATILDYAEIGDQSIIGAGALVTKGTKIPPGSMVMGMPAKVVRPLTEEERKGLRPWADKYVQVAKGHAALLKKTTAGR